MDLKDFPFDQRVAYLVRKYIFLQNGMKWFLKVLFSLKCAEYARCFFTNTFTVEKFIIILFVKIS